MAFNDNKENALKEKALIQLIKNMNINVGDSFKKWREINTIEKIKERMDNTTKENVLKVLNDLLRHSKQDMIK